MICPRCRRDKPRINERSTACRDCITAELDSRKRRPKLRDLAVSRYQETAKRITAALKGSCWLCGHDGTQHLADCPWNPRNYGG